MPESVPVGHIRAEDLARHHIGRRVRVQGVAGMLHEFAHLDSEATQMLIGDRVIEVPAGAFVAVD